MGGRKGKNVDGDRGRVGADDRDADDLSRVAPCSQCRVRPDAHHRRPTGDDRLARLRDRPGSRRRPRRPARRAATANSGRGDRRLRVARRRSRAGSTTLVSGDRARRRRTVPLPGRPDHDSLGTLSRSNRTCAGSHDGDGRSRTDGPAADRRRAHGRDRLAGRRGLRSPPVRSDRSRALVDSPGPGRDDEFERGSLDRAARSGTRRTTRADLRSLGRYSLFSWASYRRSRRSIRPTSSK